MSKYGSEYRVGRPTGVCAASGETLQPGDECIATLCERIEDEGFDRLDYCPREWESGTRPERLFSYWRTTVPASDAKEKILVDDSVLMDLFERLGQDKRQQRIAFRFILALILMRKRLLRYVRRGGGGDEGDAGDKGDNEIWFMRPKGSDPDSPLIEVINPQLSEEDIRELSDQLTEVLQGEI
ncbi:MAG: hypothetical protein IH984_14475 [Planctomycetes bacterium]|nr:hypothetical protein [Planctomycetota bacterium]